MIACDHLYSRILLPNNHPAIGLPRSPQMPMNKKTMPVRIPISCTLLDKVGTTAPTSESSAPLKKPYTIAITIVAETEVVEMPSMPSVTAPHAMDEKIVTLRMPNRSAAKLGSRRPGTEKAFRIVSYDRCQMSVCVDGKASTE